MQKHTDDAPDFSKESPKAQADPPEKTQAGDELKALARDVSAVFKNTPELYGSSVDLQYRNYYTRYINSEGSSFTRAQPLSKLQITTPTHPPAHLPPSYSMTLF